MKLCKDCKHCVPSSEWESPMLKLKYSTCRITDLVGGDDGDRCRDRRKTVNWFSPYCGPEGKQWEAA